MKTIDYYMALPYRMEVIPDHEEGGFTAAFPDLTGCVTCGDTMEELEKNAEDAKRVWLEAALEDGIEIPEPEEDGALSAFSGQFKLRMPKRLHRTLAANAKQEGVSMNQYILYLLTRNDTAYSAKGIKHKAKTDKKRDAALATE